MDIKGNTSTKRINYVAAPNTSEQCKHSRVLTLNAVRKFISF